MRSPYLAAIALLCACGTRTGLPIGSGDAIAGSSGGAGESGASGAGASAGSAGTAGVGGASGISGAAGMAGDDPGIRQWAQASNGGSHVCLLDSYGAVYCSGFGSQGQLGTGLVEPFSSDFLPVNGLPPTMAISAGGGHSCAISSQSEVYCWGNNEYGQLGDGQSGSGHHALAPIKVELSRPAVAVSAGGYQFGGGHTCALLDDRTVACWGYNSGGQIGNGASGFGVTVATPYIVPGVNDVVQVEAGAQHTCVLSSAGAVWCWGYNYAGQSDPDTAGEGSMTLTPVRISTLPGPVRSIVASNDVSCALTSTNDLWCWGSGGFGQFGTTFSSQAVPPSPAFSPEKISVADMGASHGCVITTDARVLCAGLDDLGEVGTGAAGPFVIVVPPVQVAIDSIPSQISTGTSSTCVLSQSGTVMCWGDWFGMSPKEIVLP